jgi:hypothetical protein
MRQSRLSGSVEGVMGNHDSYSDSKQLLALGCWLLTKTQTKTLVIPNLYVLGGRGGTLRQAQGRLCFSLRHRQADGHADCDPDRQPNTAGTQSHGNGCSNARAQPNSQPICMDGRFISNLQRRVPHPCRVLCDRVGTSISAQGG